jgi:MinD-like ATPase involved in chromosome partitioning or flagellar assembly
MQITAVYSPKGGSGKTTIALNLAAELAIRHPRRVLLFDLAMPYNHAALIANVRPTSSLADAAVAGQDAFRDAIWAAVVEHGHGFGILTGAIKAEDAWLINWTIVSPALDILAPEFDHVVVDLPVTTGESTLTLLDNAHHVVLVAGEELAAARDVSGMAGQIGADRLVLVLNHRQHPSLISAADFEKSIGLPVSIEIDSESTRLEKWSLEGAIPVRDYPTSNFAKAIRSLGQWLDGGARIPYLASSHEDRDLDAVKGRLLSLIRKNRQPEATAVPTNIPAAYAPSPTYDQPVGNRPAAVRTEPAPSSRQPAPTVMPMPIRMVAPLADPLPAMVVPDPQHFTEVAAEIERVPLEHSAEVARDSRPASPPREEHAVIDELPTQVLAEASPALQAVGLEADPEAVESVPVGVPHVAFHPSQAAQFQIPAPDFRPNPAPLYQTPVAWRSDPVPADVSIAPSAASVLPLSNGASTAPGVSWAPTVAAPGRCTSAGCGHQARLQCSYVDSGGVHCQTWWCDAHAALMDRTPFCRRHASVVQVLSADRGTIREKKTLPAVDDRSIGLVTWLASDLTSDIAKLLRESYREDSSVSVNGDRSVRAVWRDLPGFIPSQSGPPEITRQRGLSWEWSWAASNPTGYLKTVVLSVPTTGPQQPSQVVLKVDRHPVFTATPQWAGSGAAESVRRADREHLKSALLSAVRQSLLASDFQAQPSGTYR